MKLYIILIVLSSFSWVYSNAQEAVHLDNGSQYIITQSSQDSSRPKKGDVIKMKLAKYAQDGTLIFDTEMLNMPDGVEMTIQDDFIPGDILDVFLRMHKNEKAIATIPVWVADKDTVQKNQTETYSYHVQLLDFISPQKLKEQQDELLKQLRLEQKALFDSIVVAKASNYHLDYQKDGLYILKSSSKKIKKKQKLSTGQEIKVQYILKLLPDYKELDNSYKRNMPLTLNVNTGQVIKGWDIALLQMKKGEKSILLIPSWLAYGFYGSGHEILPNTPLYFEIEVLN
ncbi:MAG: FKBP-type peptidyl-prolyl cis-trans isomerase [Chitinophagales bacterium]|nr:FKBP-type peptidyl-prolyl cis-trans isomerase [Chitinophagales bacterium]MCZ2394550.1 FKBP-type peptidyl-prolyl cis-trans isomerase [Chitinophagales bacterium]